MSKITILDNKKCKIDLDDKDFIHKVFKLLSFKQEGVEYTQAFKNGWSGVTYLINKKNEFPLGLLSKVEDFLKQENVPYIVEDKRKPIPPEHEIDIEAKLAKINRKPRDYQMRVVNAALDNPKGIIRACTGAGKTLCAALIAAKVNKPTVVYVIGIDLLKQFHDTFSEIFDEPIGYIGDGICDVQRINIVSIWTAGKALGLSKKELLFDDENPEEKFNESNSIKITNALKKTKLHIFDECHTITTSTAKAIYQVIDPERIYGLSGTPYRDDGADILINGILGEQIINISASELIEKKFLAQPIIQFVNVPAIHVYSRTYHGVYKDYVVDNVIRNQLILNKTKMLVEKGYQTLVLFKQISHGRILHDLLCENDIKCELLMGNDSLKKREEVKERLTNREINVILASSIFDIGVDLPSLSGLILAGSGKSSIRALQRIGRVIRSYEGKKNAAIIDFIDNVRFLKNHSKIRYGIYKSESGFKVHLPHGVKI